jgi:hypothetical protein
MYNVVVVVNGGKNVISRKLLDELAAAAGAETWECIDLPTESVKSEAKAPREPSAACGCRKSDKSVVGFSCGSCKQMIRGDN